MKYKRFRRLLVAMSLTLAGIICLQVYWLDKAAKAEQRKFEENVQRAMAEATTRLETGEAFTLISDALMPKTPEHGMMIITDSVVTGGGKNKTIRVFGSAPVPPPGIAYSDSFQVPIPPLPPGIREIDSSMLAVPPMPPHPPLLMMDSNVYVIDSSPNVVLMRTQRFKSAVKDVWMEYIRRDGKASERVSREQIGKALSESFRTSGIDEPFFFGVYNGPTQEFEMLSDSLRKNELREKSFRVPLFPSDMRPGGEELRVVLHSDNSRIFRALWPQLLTAFVLTGVLILVFFFTFREALRQKKLSDIRNDFINNMTHEFKTPIATISLATDTMVNPSVIGDGEKVRHYADVIRRENKRMNDQVEKVLELALAERNELQLLKEPLDLRDLLNRAVQSMALQVSARNGSIKLETEAEILPLKGDAFHLERTFTNLLDNAVKYSRPGVPLEVIVHAAANATSITIDVTDNGMGIPEEEHSRIFDRFYRVPTGDRHDVKGFGLGLSYVKTIVEKHGGTIRVKSRPGKGSTFTVTLPV